jgi:hypothetical protein
MLELREAIVNLTLVLVMAPYYEYWESAEFGSNVQH